MREVVFTNQVCKFQDKYIRFPKTSLKLNIGKLFGHINNLKEVRVSPAYGKFKVEIVTEQSEPTPEHINNNRYMSIDLGIHNVATIITNTGAIPVLVKGNMIKSMNESCLVFIEDDTRETPIAKFEGDKWREFSSRIHFRTFITSWFIKTMAFKLSCKWLIIPFWWTTACRTEIPKGPSCRPAPFTF